MCEMSAEGAAHCNSVDKYRSGDEENGAPLLADVKAIDEALKKNPGLLNVSLESKFDDVKANLPFWKRMDHAAFTISFFPWRLPRWRPAT